MTSRNETSRSRVEASKSTDDSQRDVTSEEVFKLIGNGTRIRILDTLWEMRGPSAMGFADLRKALGIRDGSRFNYHLRKLVDGGFIEKVDGKYVIRHAGAEVIWALRSGYLTDHPKIGPFETTGRCYECDAPLHARYEDEMFFVECSTCTRLHSLGLFPPKALVGRTPEEALLAHERVARSNTGLAIEGICLKCNSPMDRTLARDGSQVPVQSLYLDPEYAGALRARYVCSNCGVWVVVSPGEAVIDHPVVVEFYHQHGFDIRTHPRWALSWTIDDSVLEVVSEDPFRVRLTIALAGDELVLTLDESFNVVAID